MFLQITKHFNKVDSPLAIPVTFSCGVQTAIFNVLVNVQFQLAERSNLEERNSACSPLQMQPLLQQNYL